MAAPPSLMSELVEEILLRIPPDDPASLVRAALACKRWCRLVASARFRRRLREIHRGRAAPLLGFLCDLRARDGFPDLRAHDARHGRVLLHTYRYSRRHLAFLVWDPLTDERRELPRPPRYPDERMDVGVLTADLNLGAVDIDSTPFMWQFTNSGFALQSPVAMCPIGTHIILGAATTDDDQELVAQVKNTHAQAATISVKYWEHPQQVPQVKDTHVQAATFSAKANSCCSKMWRGRGQ